jgi:glycosyltransferase involved in cell wall biosynthesis
MRLGIIARSDNTGLGNQTKELVDMLKPTKILLIDSTPFNKNNQHPEWYKDYDCIRSTGFPTLQQIKLFLNEVDIVISCETFYDQNFVKYAQRRGVKTILQYNYELFGNLAAPNLPLPNILLSPSVWHIDHVKKLFDKQSTVMHLPPPTNPSIFLGAKEINMSKDHNRILHIAGKKAAKDRNGTDTVLEMLKYSKADYELVIRSQSEIQTDVKDSRLTIEIGNPDNREDMYSGFDAMVLPRRYAGLCLPMNEALMSALPVFMTDISPNNYILPKEWLVESSLVSLFRTKVRIELFEAKKEKLANQIDEYINNKNKNDHKERAYQIGIDNFSPENLLDKYLEVISHI